MKSDSKADAEADSEQTIEDKILGKLREIEAVIKEDIGQLHTMEEKFQGLLLQQRVSCRELLREQRRTYEKLLKQQSLVFWQLKKQRLRQSQHAAGPPSLAQAGR